MNTSDKYEEAKRVLKKYFGHDSFREGQEKIIHSLIDGIDAVAIMPTGAGKSMCYQIPAIMADGITLVISPLISLMNDQVMSLVQSGVRGAYYNSSLTVGQSRKMIENMRNGMYKIIYVAPERLENEYFISVCQRLNVSYIAVDEAHCMSFWGQDFRPSYLKIIDFVNKLPKRPVIGAFTATATRKVRSDIREKLMLDNPVEVITGFDRPNLRFEVRQFARTKDKEHELYCILKQREDKSGIIYCSTRKEVDSVYDMICEWGINAAKYHAGMDNDERLESQNNFIYDRKPVIVATNAFGMGIDKSNVSYVIHYNMPKDLESYYQEAGRAGRDGSDAECILLYMKKDIFTIKFFIENGSDNDDLTEEQLQQKRRLDIRRMNDMINYCTTTGCLRSYILRYFGERSIGRCDNCSSCNGYERFEINTVREAAVLGISSERKADKVKQIPELTTDREKALFEKLREMRRKMASVQGVPPYVIFSDRTMIDICKKLPVTKEALLEVSGIGAAKAEKYGERVINVIKEFNELN